MLGKVYEAITKIGVIANLRNQVKVLEKEQVVTLNKEEFLIKTLNEVLLTLEPIPVKVLNQRFKAKDIAKLQELEELNTKIGIVNDGVSVLSLVATITDLLIGKRLYVVIDEDDPEQIIKRFGLMKRIEDTNNNSNNIQITACMLKLGDTVYEEVENLRYNKVLIESNNGDLIDELSQQLIKDIEGAV